MGSFASNQSLTVLKKDQGAKKIGFSSTQTVDDVLNNNVSKLQEVNTPSDYSTSKKIIKKTPSKFGLGVNESSSLSADYNYSKLTGLGFFSSVQLDNWGWLAYATENEWVDVRLPTGVVIGDSIAEGHPNLHSRLHNNLGVFDATVQNQEGQPSFELSRRTGFYWWNHGIGGETTAQVWNRWKRDALAEVFDAGDGRPTSTLLEKPVWIWVNAGINDVSALIDVEITKSNLLKMAISAQENGIFVGFNTIGPIDSHTATQRLMQDEINQFMLNVLPDFGAYVFDYHSFMVAPLDATQLLDDLHADGVHPNKRGYAAYVAKLVTESGAPIFLDSITLESKADPDTVPSNLVDVIRANVYDKNLQKGFEVVFENGEAKLSPKFDLTNSATVRIYITEVQGGPNGAKYTGLSRVFCTFGNGGAKENQQNQLAEAVILKTSGVWAVSDSLSKGRGINSIAQSSTQITVNFDFPVNVATVSMAGSSNPYLYSVSYSARNQNSVNIKAFDLSTGLTVDPTLISDGAALSIQASRSF